MLMSRFEMDYFNKLPLKTGIKLIIKAFDDSGKARAWDMWISKYPTSEFQPFSEFYSKQDTTKKSVSKEELLENAKRIREQIEGKS